MCVCVCVCVRACVCECVSVAPTCCLQRARSTWLEPPPPVLCVRICCSAPVMRHKQTKVQMESKWLTPSLPPLLHALPSPLRTCVCMCVCVCVCVCVVPMTRKVCAVAQMHKTTATNRTGRRRSRQLRSRTSERRVQMQEETRISECSKHIHFQCKLWNAWQASTQANQMPQQGTG